MYHNNIIKFHLDGFIHDGCKITNTILQSTVRNFSHTEKLIYENFKRETETKNLKC